uniref:Integrin subunit beta 1 binding protein 2 n=1 Tax=Terrapene triunguis TaxID=2587831 RepID=A0A674I9J1_9SAUR
MALLCYNKGCGQRFDADKNSEDSCVYHPGVPIFHDVLKGWSCCKKRTTDFSEFLSIKGCMKGCHSNEKPPKPFRPEDTSDKLKAKPSTELIVQSPKSAEKMQRESSDEPRQPLLIKVSRSLEQTLEKLKLASKNQCPEGAEAIPEVRTGTTCKNSGCKVVSCTLGFVFQSPGQGVPGSGESVLGA